MSFFKKLIIFSLLVFTTNNSFSQSASDDDLQLNTITTALPFLSITPDSRAGGMGEAGTALSGNSTSIYWNTSMLSFAEKKAEIGVSYVPWLRKITNDINLSYLSGYTKLNDRHTIGGAIRYFSLGQITFTDASGDILREDKPSEFELTGAYAFKLNDKLSVGLNGKFAYSNLTGGLVTGGTDTRPGIIGATDLSFTYFNPNAKLGSDEGQFIFATTLNNIGNKVAYSELARRDFIPMNLKIASSYKADLDKYNSVLLALEFQKLLVPTPPKFDIDGTTIMSGRNNDVGVIAGLIQSFYDAPGVVETDENGDYIQNSDGSYQVKKGSRLKEELTEINIATGLEYWYNNVFALRTGFFYENRNKGNRRYVNFGAGFNYNNLGIDMSYLVSVSGQDSPLANTLRFTLRFTFGDSPVKENETAE
jgi:hypothetical protein